MRLYLADLGHNLLTYSSDTCPSCIMRFGEPGRITAPDSAAFSVFRIAN